MSTRGAPKRVLRAACIATLTAVALVAGLLSPAPASAQQDIPDGLLPPGDWASWQVDYMLDLIAEAEDKLPQFSNPSQLAALGYVNIGVTAPGGIDHYVNVRYFNDEHFLNFDYPESLVFIRGRLVAAMMFLSMEYDMTNIPAEIAWLPGWHVHPELCSTPDGRIVGFTLPGTNNCPSGSAPSERPPMMHVWIEDNECGHRFGGVGVGGVHCDDYGTPLPEEGYPFGMDVEADADGAVSIDTVSGEPLMFPTGSEGVCNPDGEPTVIMGSVSEDHGGGHATVTGLHAMPEPADLVVTDDGAICGTVDLDLGDGEIMGSGDSGSFTISDVSAELEIVGTGAFAQHIPEGCSLSVDIGELSGTIAGDGSPNAASLSASGSVAEAPEACGAYGNLLNYGLSLPSTDAGIDLDLSVRWVVEPPGHDH